MSFIRKAGKDNLVINLNGVSPSINYEEYMSFDGWYTDNELITPLPKYEITNKTELFGKYCPNFTVNLDVNGGEELVVKEIFIDCDRAYGDLPEAKSIGYTFAGWFTEKIGGDNVTSGDIVKILENHTLYAQWTANVYTVTFEGNEGTPSKKSMEVTFDEEYGDFPDATRTGYDFTGWFTEKTGGTNTTAWDIVKIITNQTLYAHWIIISPIPTNQTEVPTNQVEIVFSKKSMSQAEVEKIIEQYTEASFEIALIKGNNSGTGEIRVIIKFTDIDVAKEFVRNVNDGLKSGKEGNLIRRAHFSSDNIHVISFSQTSYPMWLPCLI